MGLVLVDPAGRSAGFREWGEEKVTSIDLFVNSLMNQEDYQKFVKTCILMYLEILISAIITQLV